MTDSTPTVLHKTPLHALHVALGARMVPFAGYDMPVQYPSGIIAEHTHTRASAGLFDVSHMGQGWLIGPDHATTARALETLVPADMVALQPGQQRYSQLLNDSGGTIDDLMISRSALPGTDGRLYLIVNASRKAVDFAHLRAKLPASVTVAERPHWALVAVQGPKAAAALERLLPGVTGLAFMTGRPFPLSLGGRTSDVYVTRSGYTGEDGFEISLPAAEAARGARLILSQPEVAPAGLGARDTLRLEAGLCLYGQDIDESTSPAEAGLGWTIPKCRREGPRRGGFPGAEIILGQIAAATPRRRVGLLPEIKAPLRHGEIVYDDGERQVGRITSGGFGPSVGAAIAMAYVEAGSSAPGTRLHALVRGQKRICKVAGLPFVSHRYFRGPAT